jgi:hypothetical protein
MSKYSHSEAFAVLKATNEKIVNNLTSYQYLTVLDDHLYNAITNLVTNTKFFDVFLSQIIGWQTLNPKRKTCGVGRHELVSLSTLFFLTNDGKQKMKLVRRMKLHRNILFEAINRWLRVLSEYPTLSMMVGTQDVVEKLFDLNESALMRQGFSLHSTFQLITYWTKQAKDFKEQIMQKYTRSTISTAQRDYVALGCPGRLDDFVQIYMMTMSKAIDKCDSDRGVLTNHISNWLLSAKNNAQAQAMDNGGDKHQYQHVSLDDVDISISSEDDLERSSIIERVRYIAKVFDPEGIGRILLNIQEILSPEDKQTLRSMTLTAESKTGTQ